MQGRGLVLARMRAQAGLLVTCSLLLLVGSVVLTTLALHGSRTVTDGVRERLLDLPASERLVEISVESATDGVTARELARPGTEPSEAAVLDDLSRSLGATGLPYDIHLSGRTGLIHLQDDAQPAPRLVGYAYRDLPAHADLVEGHWPGEDDASNPAVVPVALHAGAASALRLAPGDRVDVELDDAPATLQVVGTWRPRSPTDPYFGGQPLEVQGVDGPSTFGPVVPADPSVLGKVDLRWRVVPAVGRVHASDLSTLGAGLARLVTSIREDPRLADPDVFAPLRPHVGELERQAVTATSVGAVSLVVVAVLLLAGLVLTAGLLVDRRAGEALLVGARGASGGQLARWAVAEVLLLALPTLVLAAPAAWLVLQLPGGTSATGWPPSPLAWQVALATGLAGAAGLLAPSLAATREWRSRAAAAASGRRRATTRAGLELVLLVLAVVAVWQLRRYSGTSTTSRAGDLSADPVLVAAPALAMLAGSVLATRLVPLGVGLAARWWARRPGAPLALTGWRAARRPGAHAPAVLLLSLGVAAGVLASGYSASWQAEQVRTAAARVGADVQVTPADEVPAPDAVTATRAAAYEAVDGVSAAASLHVEETTVGSTEATLIAADTRALRRLDGASGAGVAAAARTLAGSSSDPLPGVVLDPGTRRLEVDLVASVDVAEADPALAELPFPDSAGTPTRRLSASLWLASPDGQALELALPEIPVTTGLPVRTTARLDVPPLEGGWRVVGLEVSDQRTTFGEPAEATLKVGVDGLRTARRTGPTAAVRPAVAWSTDTEPRWHAAALTSSSQVSVAAVGGPWPAASITIPAFTSGQTGVRILGGPSLSQPLPTVITRDLARDNALPEGGRITVQHSGRRVAASVSAVVDALPGAVGPKVLVDLATLTALDLQAGAVPPAASTWWLALDDATRRDDDTRSAVVQEVEATGEDGDTVLDRVALARRLADIPPASAVPDLLLAGAVAAIVLAGAGLVVATTAAAGRRSVEHAVLHALGLSRRQAARMTFGETAGIGLLAVLAGGAIGWVVAVLTLPALVVPAGTGGNGAGAGAGGGAGGGAAAPVAVSIGPGGALAVAAGLVVVALVAGCAVLVGSRSRRGGSREDTARRVRPGEDR